VRLCTVKAKKLSEEAFEAGAAAAAAATARKVEDATATEALRARILLKAVKEKEKEDAAAREKIQMVATKCKSKSGSYVMFPHNLHDLLDNAKNLGYERAPSLGCQMETGFEFMNLGTWTTLLKHSSIKTNSSRSFGNFRNMALPGSFVAESVAFLCTLCL
jgi:hypothetical protein